LVFYVKKNTWMDFENEACLRVCEPRDRSFLPLKYTYLLLLSVTNIISLSVFELALAIVLKQDTLYNEGIVFGMIVQYV